MANEAREGEERSRLQSEPTLHGESARTPADHSQPPSTTPYARRAFIPATDALIADKYRLRRCLGEGGMGSVWAAHSLALDAEVAIKVIRPDLVNSKMAERLLVEARSAAKIRHPAIVQVLDFGTIDDQTPYLVMEFLRGESLHERIARGGRLSPHAAVQILLPIADALAAVHDEGIIHRDLKPENILVAHTPAGPQPKLLDFGIAKLGPSLDPRLTGIGTPVGSPFYMAPEQALGLGSDARSDVWGFCVLLHEAVTGTPPFCSEDYGDLVHEIAHGELKSFESRGVQAPGLEAILRRGLAKRPAQRWASMRDLYRELANWLVSEGIHADITGKTLHSTQPQPVTLSPGRLLLESRTVRTVASVIALAALLLVASLLLRGGWRGASPAVDASTTSGSVQAPGAPSVGPQQRDSTPSKPAVPSGETPTVAPEPSVASSSPIGDSSSQPEPAPRAPPRANPAGRNPTPATPNRGLDDIKMEF